jgi:CRP/FNR family cyclic AMP-dependent transcriptional regulator
MSGDERLGFLRIVPMFSGMDDVELAALARDLNRRSYASGESIFFQGDSGESVYVIESGRVRIYVHAEDGQEVSVVLYGPGDMFGEMSLLDRRPRSATATAMDDVVLLVLSAERFDRHLRDSHQLALNVMLTLSTRLRETTEAIRSLSSMDVNRRVVQKLLSLARKQGVPVEEGIRIRGRLTQQALASLISASRESTNRALRALSRKGLIDVQQGQIVLLEMEELTNLVAEK